MINSPDIRAKSEEIAARLKLIANANRLRIICQLRDGELSVGDIETVLNIRQPTLSREIAKLRDGGIITARRQSKVVFYTLTDPDMKRLIDAICMASFGSPAHPQLSDQKTDRSHLALDFNPRPKFMQKNAKT